MIHSDFTNFKNDVGDITHTNMKAVIHENDYNVDSAHTNTVWNQQTGKINWSLPPSNYCRCGVCHLS